jgi:hypothetical protein
MGAAFTLIQQVRSVRDKVKGAFKILESVCGQLKNLKQSFILVRKKKTLQTIAVE